MAQAPQLQARQSQSLVVTPQLQQAIKMLQLNAVELQAYVATQVEANPFLDFEEPGEFFEEGDTPSADQDSGSEEGEDPSEMLDSEALADADHWPEDSGGGDEGFDPLDLVSDETSLRDQLESVVISAAFKSPADIGMARALLEGVDAAGYLILEPADVASRLAVKPAQIISVLVRLQKVATPAGLFARNLAECLRLQLEDRDLLTKPMQALVENLPLLGARDFPKLERLCKVDRATLSSMVKRLRTLDPKPGAQFGGVPNLDVIPDVVVEARADGTFQVRHHSQAMPMVRLARTYADQVKKQARAGKERAFVRENVTSANWLLRALAQRASTVLAVTKEIVERQTGFFQWGVEHLTPMVLREIAQAIEMHESTVSRVTAGKYLTCPRGVFELKYFFTTAISGAGTDHSASSVKARLRSLIDAETRVLSDDALVKALQAEGIDLARRTVAKYREAMNIPSSVARRREKRLTVRDKGQKKKTVKKRAAPKKKVRPIKSAKKQSGVVPSLKMVASG